MRRCLMQDRLVDSKSVCIVMNSWSKGSNISADIILFLLVMCSVCHIIVLME